MIITIDGPTASGKSSNARAIADKLNFYYLYTGLLYRAVAYILINHYGYTLEQLNNPDIKLVHNVVEQLTYAYINNTVSIVFEHKDITPFLKDGSIDHAASTVSSNAHVRESINQLQRAIAQKQNMVVDGRDSGSVVFPHADYKFFLTATLDERARRWQQAQKDRGNEYTFEQAKQMVQTRDARDQMRAAAPLKAAKDAIVVDNSDMSFEQTVKTILSYIDKT